MQAYSIAVILEADLLWDELTLTFNELSFQNQGFILSICLSWVVLRRSRK